MVTVGLKDKDGSVVRPFSGTMDITVCGGTITVPIRFEDGIAVELNGNPCESKIGDKDRMWMRGVPAEERLTPREPTNLAAVAEAMQELKALPPDLSEEEIRAAYGVQEGGPSEVRPFTGTMKATVTVVKGVITKVNDRPIDKPILSRLIPTGGE